MSRRPLQHTGVVQESSTGCRSLGTGAQKAGRAPSKLCYGRKVANRARMKLILRGTEVAQLPPNESLTWAMNMSLAIANVSICTARGRFRGDVAHEQAVGGSRLTLINVLVARGPRRCAGPRLCEIGHSVRRPWRSVPSFIWRDAKASPELLWVFALRQLSDLSSCASPKNQWRRLRARSSCSWGIFRFLSSRPRWRPFLRREVARASLCAFLIRVAMVSCAKGGIGEARGRRTGFGSRRRLLGCRTRAALCVAHILTNLGNDRVPALPSASRSELALAPGTDSATRARVIARARGIAARLAHEVKNPALRDQDLEAHGSQRDDPQMAERLGIVASEADRPSTDGRRLLSFLRGFDRASPRADGPLRAGARAFGPARGEGRRGGCPLDVTGNADLELQCRPPQLRQCCSTSSENRHPGIGARASPVAVEVRGPRLRRQGHDQRGDRSRSGMSPRGRRAASSVLNYTTAREARLRVVVARALIEQHGGVLTYQTAARPGHRGHHRSADQPPETARARKLPDPSRDPMDPCVFPDSRTTS